MQSPCDDVLVLKEKMNVINQAIVLCLSVSPASAAPSPNSSNFLNVNVLPADPPRLGPDHTSTMSERKEKLTIKIS